MAPSRPAAVSGRAACRLLASTQTFPRWILKGAGAFVLCLKRRLLLLRLVSAPLLVRLVLVRPLALPTDIIMTFTTDNVCNNSCETGFEKSSLTIGQALERCLSRAVAAQRVTVGIQECAKLLGCAPERVMLCVIPDMADSADVGLHIQHTLVRSFCWENDIRLLTVKNCEKLQNIVNSARATTAVDSDTPDVSTPSCLLVEMPKDDVSNDEDFVCNYHDTVIYSDIYPKPIIQLPV